MNNTEYGKCVFKCNNNVVDHQTVNMRFGDDVYVDFSMNAFTKGGRVIRIMGTKGEINAAMEGNKISVYSFITQTTREHDCNAAVSGEMITGGHGGGDKVMLCDIFSDNPPYDELNRAASHIDGVYSIMTGICANKSIATGLPVKVEDMIDLK
jgi:predicted dehydrogenase